LPKFEANNDQILSKNRNAKALRFVNSVLLRLQKNMT